MRHFKSVNNECGDFIQIGFHSWVEYVGWLRLLAKSGRWVLRPLYQRIHSQGGLREEESNRRTEFGFNRPFYSEQVCSLLKKIADDVEVAIVGCEK